ncbi:MAG: FtsX-like permease family protein [Coriobacteriia bacterium]|nr:FtsX-like permease family protein [Coriobacteriia bacterium]
MNKNLVKDFFRTIRKNLGRFLSLFGIIAIGAGFFAGLNMASPDMKLSADTFYDGYNLMDIRVVSTLGLSQENIDKISSIEEIDEVMPNKETDAIISKGDTNITTRIQAIPEAAYSSYTSSQKKEVISNPDSGPYINRLDLSRGEWPKNNSECVLLDDIVTTTPIDIGDEIQITKSAGDINRIFNTNNLKVVGFVHSPMFTCSVALGTSAIGIGSIQQAVFVPNDTFKSDLPYTEIYITVKDSKKYINESDEYKNYISSVQNKIELICPTIAIDRTNQLKREITDMVDSKSKDVDTKKLETEANLESAISKLNDSYKQLTKGQASIDEARVKINNLTNNYKQLETSLDVYNHCLNQLKLYISSLPATYDDSVLHKLTKYSDYLIEMNSIINNQITLIKSSSLDSTITEPLLTNLNILSVSADQLSQATLQFIDAIKLSPKIYDTQIVIFVEGAELIHDALSKFAEAEASVCSKIKSSIDSAESELNTQEAKIRSGFLQYNSGLATYNSSKEKAINTIADAYKTLLDVRDSANNIENCELYVTDRTKIMSTVSYSQDAERIAKIALVFPLFFFLVAALVTLTSMTRMIDEERTLVGTYKSLGISKLTISLRYLFYAGVISIFGAIIGICVLSVILPYIIISSYEIIYYLPHISIELNGPIFTLSLFSSVFLTVFVSFLACSKTFRESPAALTQPEAPRPGKRILLEHFKLLWLRLSFNAKITIRNLFRYKKKLFMTIIGIAGCFALLLTGFGLHDSINDIIDINYSEIVHDDCQIIYSPNASEQELSNVAKLVGNKDYVNEEVALYSENCIIKTDEGIVASDQTKESNNLDSKDDNSNISSNSKNFNIVMGLVSNNKFTDFRTMRSRTEKGPCGGQVQYRFDYNASNYIDDNYWDGDTYVIRHGAIVCEKIAEKMNLHLGDKLRVYTIDKTGDPKLEYYLVEVAGICENYVKNFIYMSKPDFSNSAGCIAGNTKYKTNDKKNNTILCKLTDDESARNEFVKAGHNVDAIGALELNSGVINKYKNMLKTVDGIVVVLIISAAILAFIVLYNLTNINITERRRELAALRVLGFTSKETMLYIHRETFILCILGILLGLVFGYFLEGFVIKSAEVDFVMFGRTIHAFSYFISCIITVIFTLIVIVFTKRKVKAINMAESLKSVD